MRPEFYIYSRKICRQDFWYRYYHKPEHCWNIEILTICKHFWSVGTHSQYAFYRILSAFVQYWSCKKFSPFSCNICLYNQIISTCQNFLYNLKFCDIRLTFLWQVFMKGKRRSKWKFVSYLDITFYCHNSCTYRMSLSMAMYYGNWLRCNLY